MLQLCKYFYVENSYILLFIKKFLYLLFIKTTSIIGCQG